MYKKGPFGSSITKSMFVPKSEKTYKVYEQRNAIYKNTEMGNYYITEEKFNELKSFEVFPNDIIVSCAGTIGESYVLPLDAPKGVINQALMKITLFFNNIKDFYLIYFDTILKNQSNIDGKGSAMKNIPPFDILKKYLIPIPPLVEQQLIIKKIEGLFAQVDKIEEEKQSLLKLIDRAKEKVLDLAMKGELVKQDPNDEPASVLLEKIFEEKKKLAKEGKIKISKDELLPPQISDDNDYYQNLPVTWSLCQLCNTSFIINGDRSKNYPSKSKLLNYGSIPFVSALNIQDEQISLKEMKYLSQEQYDKLYSGKLQHNDIVYCIRGSLGKCCLFDKIQGAIASSLVIVRVIKVSPEYIIKVLNTKFIKEQITKYNNGTAQPNLAAKDFKKFLIPLPPLHEQARIVKQIELILKKLNQIKDSL